MTTTTSTAPAVGAWQATPACADPGVIDLLTVDDWSPPEDLAAARDLCAGCPVLPACDQLVATQRVYGFAAGMTEAERVAAGLPGGPLSTVRSGEATEPYQQWIDEQSIVTRDGKRLSEELLRAVWRLTLAGISARDIARRLQILDATVNVRTIEHARRLIRRRTSGQEHNQ